jgi:hypothetical protein
MKATLLLNLPSKAAPSPEHGLRAVWQSQDACVRLRSDPCIPPIVLLPGEVRRAIWHPR